MGRMANARKRARRGERSGGPGFPEPLEAAAPHEPAAAPGMVFADEPTAGEEPPRGAAPAGEKVALPASGLAEDILRQIQAEPSPSEAVARVGPTAPSRSVDVLAGTGASGSHSLSFFAAPAQEQRAAAEATEHLATFFLDREEYGVDVRQVQEIRRVTEITSVPRAPDFVRGVINLRGRILPVLDLRRKLGLGEVEAGRKTRIVVVRVNERLLGLLVDGASQVLKVGVSRIEPPPTEVVEKGGDYIRGVAKLDDRLIILVDLERLLAHELRAAGAPAASMPGAEGPDAVS
jgi:purine-binding chemotaxis protein CheW